MKEIFHLSPYMTHKKHENTTKYGGQSLKALKSHVWNSLPEKIKKLASLNTFKEFMKIWFGPKCKCSLGRK